MSKPKPLQKRLLKMRAELELARRHSETFVEETVINSVIYAVGHALDVLNGKALLQGLNHSGDEAGDEKSTG